MVQDMSLEETFDKLGLTKYESQAYYYIIQNGPVEAAEITRDTNIPNGKIYETLNKLENNGFIEIQQSRPKKYLSRNINIAIEEFLEQKKEDFELEFKKLETLGNQAIKEFEQIHINKEPKKEEIFWRTAFGTEIHDVYFTTIKETKHSILYFLPHSMHDRSFSPESLHKHINEKNSSATEEKDFISKLLTLKEDKSIKILFAGKEECPYFKEIFKDVIENKTSIKVKGLREDIITAPMLLVDDNITIMDIVDPLDNHSTIGITKIWDRRLNNNLKEKISVLWQKAEEYKNVFQFKTDH